MQIMIVMIVLIIGLLRTITFKLNKSPLEKNKFGKYILHYRHGNSANVVISRATKKMAKSEK